MPQLAAQIYSLAVEQADKVPPAVLVAMAPATIILYFVGLIFYRLWLHPLAHVPGPFWNKITFLAEFHYHGDMWKKIGEWHDRYGPVIRITPDEVHIDDSTNIETFDQCHRVGTKWSKDETFYGKFRGECVTGFTFGSNALHRQRRSQLHPAFSRKAVTNLEPFVQGIVLNLIKIIKENGKKPFNMYRGFRCVALDTITSYALGKSTDILHTQDLGQAFIDTVRGHLSSLWLMRILPMPMAYALTHMPPFLAKRMDTSQGVLPKIRAESIATIEKVKKNPDFRGSHGGKTMFHDVIWAGQAASDEAIIPEELDEAEKKWLIAARIENSRNLEKTKGKYLVPESDMVEEIGSAVVAGVDSTGTTMEMTLLAIITHENVRQRLVKDINAAFPGGVETHTWQGLERVPYMAACVKEGLRMANGIIGRLPRVVEDRSFRFKGYSFPKGTIISQSTVRHHRNAEIFPEPDSFMPERWLNDNEKKLEKYLNPFGKGSRACLGRELAMCEVYLALAAVICTFPDMKVHESSGFQTLDEVPFVDYFLTYYPDNNPGLQVIV